MDSQIENAIEIAWNPQADQSLKNQAFEFINRLRADAQAWHVCATLFRRVPRASDVVRVVCLEIVNHAIARLALDGASLGFLKTSLFEHVGRVYGGAAHEPPDSISLQNKLTQTLTYLFMALYGNGWPTFMDDFLALTRSPNSSQPDNLAGVTLYLRVLRSIHEEIADPMLARQGSDSKRNGDLKDLIRARDIRRIAGSWQDMLAYYSDKNDSVLEMTLKVIGKWVSWTDIALVINQDMLNWLLPLVGRTKPDVSEDKVRDAAIDTLTEIVAKKMRPAVKIDMLEFLNLGEITARLIESPPLHEFKGTSRYDTDLAEAVAKLVNTTMTDVVRVLEDGKISADAKQKAEQHLQVFLPFLLRFFADDFDEVCATVIPSLTDLLTLLRKTGALAPAYPNVLPAILEAIVMKMRYDETTTWGEEDEQTDEAEFHELRRRLQNLQKSVAAVDQNLYIDFMSNLAANAFGTLEQQGSRMDWRDLDLALYCIYHFGELALSNTGLAAKSQPNPVAAERLAGMMGKMVESGIASFAHPAVLLQYMEICNRYCNFFETHQHYIPQVLESFVQLAHHSHPRVRFRAWYLFLRVAKQLRGQVGNIAKTVIESISDLLPIKAEVSSTNENDDDMSSDETDHSADAVFNSQLSLFEAIGSISSTQATPPEEQAAYARSVLEPLFADMSQHLSRAKAGDAQAVLQIHHIVIALGTLASGFSEHSASQAGQRPPPSEPISHVFTQASEAILIALNQLNGNGEIRAACRSAFSRLLGVLGAAILPQLPQWIAGLLSSGSRTDEMAMFLHLLEQVVYNFKGEIYTILDQLLTPLLERVFAGLSEPINGTDDEIQLQELRKEYVTFIQIILCNDLGGVLVSTTNQAVFETFISSILMLAKTVAHGNLTASRIGFNVLAKMALLWGGPDVATISAENNNNNNNNTASSSYPLAASAAASPAIPGFDTFMLSRFHTACWEVLLDAQFRPSDAQSRQVLAEIAGLEQTIYLKTGDALVRHLEAVTFPAQLGLMDEDARAEFLRAMASSTDRKQFAVYLQNLIGKVRR